MFTTAFAVTLLAWLAIAAAAGCWTTTAFLQTRTGRDRMRLGSDRLPLIGGGCSLLAAALCATLGLTTTQGPTAWYFAAVVLVLGALLSLWRAWEGAIYALLCCVLALLAPWAEARQGINHDLTADAAMVAMVAFAVLAGTWAWSPSVRAGGHESVVVDRLRFLSVAAAAVVVVCDLVSVWALPGGLSSGEAGFWHLVRAACALLIAGLAFAPRRVAAPLATLVGVVGLASSTWALRAGDGPTDNLPADITALGYSVAEWPTLANLVLHGRVNLFFLGLSVVAVAAYLWFVAILRRRGDRWPVGRTIAWLIGWGLVAFLTSSGIGRYAPASFSVHMFMNLGLNMAAAMILSLGGFITLLLRATRARGRDEPAGLREWVAATMHSRYLGFIYNPIVALVFMTGSYYVFYLTSIYPTSLQTHWLHQFVYLHFLVSGYIFYGLIIGVDQPPHPLPHIGKLGLIIGAMPFHAFFGVILMAKTTVYAEGFLTSLGYPWVATRGLTHDQYVGGAIAWAGGEFPLVIALVALLVQWQRQDSTEARRVDRHLDRGTDQTYDAYNEMMARLAAADREAEKERR